MSIGALFERVHHVGVAVRDLPAATAWFVAQGAVLVGDPYADLAQDVDVQMLELAGLRHELVAPRSPSSAVARVLARGGGGAYHVAYAHADLAELDERVRAAGGLVVSRTTHGWGGLEVAFAVFDASGTPYLAEFVALPPASPPR